MNATKVTVLSAAVLFLARGPALTSCDTSAGDTKPPATSRPAPDGNWTVTDSYFDPQFSRTTVICVDHHGDLQAASGWREIAAAAPVGAPCPTGTVLIDAHIAWP